MWERERFDRICEWAISGLVGGAAIFAALALGAVRATEFAGVVAMVAAALAVWVIRIWLGDDHRFLLPPVVWPILLFGAYVIWRRNDAPVEYFARQELLMVLVYAALFVLVIHNLHRQETLQWVIAVLAVVGMCLSFYALVQLTSTSPKVWWFLKPRNYLGRGGGTFINPNHLAGLLVMILPLAVAQVFVSRSKPVIKILYAYASMAIVCGIAVTMSRGGWLAAAVAASLFFGWLWQRRHYRLPALALLILIVGGAWFYFTRFEAARERIEGMTREGTAHAGHSRKYLVGPSVAIWLDHPWLGAGPGQFNVVFPRYRPPSLQVPAIGHAHNEYLELLADYGAIGAAIVISGLALLGWSVVRTSKFVGRGSPDFGFKTSNRTAFFLGATIGLIAFFVHCAIEFHWHIPGVALTATALIALLGSTIRFATERYWVTPRWWSRTLVTVGVMAWMAWVIPVSHRAFREGQFLNSAAQAAIVDQELIETLKRAHLLDPTNPRTLYELGENLRRLSWEGSPGWEKQAEEALGWLEKSAALDPFHARTWLSIAQCHSWLRHPEDATRYFQKALESGPNDALIANHSAWDAMTKGHTERARELFEQSLSWWPWGNTMAEQNLETLRKMKLEP